MTYSPLEQFDIITLLPIRFLDLDFSITNSTLYLAIALGTFSLLLRLSMKVPMIVPSLWQCFFEKYHIFLLTLTYQNLGKIGFKYYSLIFTVFSFILSCNLLGMVPYSFTVTSHMAVTFSLAFALFLGLTIVGLAKHKLHFFSLFVPSGAPKALLPFIVTIEVISYIARTFSLPIRLFANMMSGHTLLKIIAGFGWTMITAGGALALFSVIPIALVFIITGLEIAVAILQAYVFTILLCIYLNDVIHLH